MLQMGQSEFVLSHFFALFRKTAEAVRKSVQVRVVDPLSRTTKRQFDRNLGALVGRQSEHPLMVA
jgi:hypothetical protein